MNKTPIIAIFLTLMLLMPLVAMAEDINARLVAADGVSPTTGLPVEEGYQHIPMAVNVCLEPASRPQWGLSQADVIYEAINYAGGFTRLTAIFANDLADHVGPVRSYRIHHVNLASEWGAAMVHFGAQTSPGSNAKEYGSSMLAKGYIMADVDAMSYENKKGICVRESSRRAPWNVSVNLGGLIDAKGLGAVEGVGPLRFSPEGLTSGDEATFVEVSYNKLYSAQYSYDKDTALYTRYYCKRPDLDGNDDESPLTFANVIVQTAHTSFFNGDGSRPNIQLIGEGDAHYFAGGQHVSGHWRREGAESRTVYMDDNGDEISFKPGKTFIHIVDNNTSLDFDGNSQMGDEDE